jgi:hypothetical protein
MHVTNLMASCLALFALPGYQARFRWRLAIAGPAEAAGGPAPRPAGRGFHHERV